MGSIIPNFNYPKKDGSILYHYHKLEIIQQPTKISAPQPMNGVDRVKSAVAGILIFLGSVMAILASVAITLQTAGLCTPEVTILANLLMPSIAAILTGSHLSKNDVRSGPSLTLPTGLPGLTFRSM